MADLADLESRVAELELLTQEIIAILDRNADIQELSRRSREDSLRMAAESAVIIRAVGYLGMLFVLSAERSITKESVAVLADQLVESVPPEFRDAASRAIQTISFMWKGPQT